MALFDCTCDATSGHARALTYTTAHGDFHTPMFMPVGTHRHGEGRHRRASCASWAARSCSRTRTTCPCAPAPTWWPRPAACTSFMNYDGPMLTDSGGFQVFSLGRHDEARSDDGVTFQLASTTAARSAGRPRATCDIQELHRRRYRHAARSVRCRIPPPREFVARAVELSGAVGRAAAWPRTPGADQTLFGIVQGGMHLRPAPGKRRRACARSRTSSWLRAAQGASAASASAATRWARTTR